MRAAELRRLQNRNAVLLALNFLAGDGFVTVGRHATDIAKLARRSVEVTRKTLIELERDGAITCLDWRDNICTRIFVLMDDPDARDFVDEQWAIYGSPRRAPRAGRRADRRKARAEGA